MRLAIKGHPTRGKEFFGIDDDNKIVLTEKQSKYPKTYEECCDIIGLNQHDVEIDLPQPFQQKMFNLFKLLICRDAYWKIAGEEMKLGKSWEPDYTEESWEQGSLIKYVIYYTGTNITKERKCMPSYILSFPTEEMRDAFYNNFKDLIEQCKELL